MASKALGMSTVYVEAIDQDGNKVVDRVESEVGVGMQCKCPCHAWKLSREMVILGHGFACDGCNCVRRVPLL